MLQTQQKEWRLPCISPTFACLGLALLIQLQVEGLVSRCDFKFVEEPIARLGCFLVLTQISSALAAEPASSGINTKTDVFSQQSTSEKTTQRFLVKFLVMGCAGAKVNAVSAAVGKKVQEHKERARLRKVAKGLGHLAK